MSAGQPIDRAGIDVILGRPQDNLHHADSERRTAKGEAEYMKGQVFLTTDLN